MTPARKKRLSLIVLLVVGVALAATFMLQAFNENVMFFYTPSEIKEGKAPTNRPFRMGGMVVEGSVIRPEKGVWVQFDLTDTKKVVTVKYEGILPDLFREGQGIIANGTLDENGVIIADEVLAKHDENYMSPEIKDMMKNVDYEKTKAKY